MNMAYAKRAKRKIKWKVVAPIIVLLCLVVYLVVSILLLPSKEVKDGVKICNYNAEKTENLIRKEITKSYEISDYLFYGENLSILKNTYNATTQDDMIGKSVKLVNLCGGDELLFQLDQSLDHQINLGELANGFYEVYVVENLQDTRVVSASPFSDTLHTITRNSTSKKVDVMATNNFLESEQPLALNPLYIQVSSDTIQHESVDIMLDPVGGNDDYGIGDLSYEANGLNENIEMYEAALVLKEKLEDYGLTVGITKDSQTQLIDTNGYEGRLFKAYTKNAKHYFSLQFNSHAYTDISGIEITHSAYASATLANQIVHDLAKVGLNGSEMIGNAQIKGVTAANLSMGSDEQSIYDSELQLRESGGVGTNAGMYNENIKSLNGGFALGNRHGMQGQVIRFVYISNQNNVSLWKNHKEEILQSVADSIAAYLKITKE